MNINYMLGRRGTISLACPKSRLLTQHNQEIAQGTTKSRNEEMRNEKRKRRNGDGNEKRNGEMSSQLAAALSSINGYVPTQCMKCAQRVHAS